MKTQLEKCIKELRNARAEVDSLLFEIDHMPDGYVYVVKIKLGKRIKWASFRNTVGIQDLCDLHSDEYKVILCLYTNNPAPGIKHKDCLYQRDIADLPAKYSYLAWESLVEFYDECHVEHCWDDENA